MLLGDIGGSVIERFAYVGQLSMQFWSSLLTIPRVLPMVGRRGRWLTAIRQMADIGVDALPMIATVSMSSGFIFAMQSGNELRRFGAISLVIDIIAIGFTRELGPLLTAIVVSSRSGSAFSAEIGTMVVTNEIDVLRTMGIRPDRVRPRTQVRGGADRGAVLGDYERPVWCIGWRRIHAAQYQDDLLDVLTCGCRFHCYARSLRRLY